MTDIIGTIIASSVGATTVILTQSAIKRTSIERVMKHVNDKTVTLNTDVSMILPTLNEESLIEQSIISLLEQNVIKNNPKRFELIVVDSESEDSTVDIAKKYTDNIIMSPRGKLTARSIGTEHANGEIIVSVDADNIYPPNWLNTMLKNMANTDNVVGVSCPKFFFPGTVSPIRDKIYNTIQLSRRFIPSMSGGNSIYTKKAYYASGGFNLNTNQFHTQNMIREEETGFWTRLKQIGGVVFDSKACVYTSPRQLNRIVCRTDNVIDSLWCRDISDGVRF